MSEQQRAERPRKKCDAECEEGIQRLRSRVAAGKEHRADHDRHREAVYVEIVELDGGADETGERDTRNEVRRGLRTLCRGLSP